MNKKDENKQNNYPNYESWLKHEVWKLEDAIYLLYSQEPINDNTDFPFLNDIVKISRFTDEIFNDAYKMAKSSIISNILYAEKVTHSGSKSIYYVKPYSFILWALEKDYELPQPFINHLTDSYLPNYINSLDNSKNVIEDLYTNQWKIKRLLILQYEAAKLEIKKLSDSIKQNQLAATYSKTPEPLSQLKPAAFGVGSVDDDIKAKENENTEAEYKPNYQDWAARDSWKIRETACLFVDVDPKKLGYSFDEYKHPVNYKLNIKPTHDVIESWFHINAPPFSWIDKALAKKFKIPPELLNAIKDVFLNQYRADEKLKKEFFYLAEECGLKKEEPTTQKSVAVNPIIEGLPAYLNERHPNFSIELKVAVEAWSDLYENNQNGGNGVDAEFERWLKKKGINNKGEAVVGRIATVITPNHCKEKRGVKPSLTYTK